MILYPGVPAIHSGSTSVAKTDSPMIHVTDHMPHPLDGRISIAGQPSYFKNTIIELCERADIDYKNKLFLFNQYLTFDDFENAVFNGNSLLWIVRRLLGTYPDWNQVPNTAITKNFSFTANKYRPQRGLMALAVKHLLPNADFSYSFNLNDNAPYELNELLHGTDYNFNTYDNLAESWTPIDPKTELKKQFGGKKHSPDFHHNFKILYDNIYSGSPISVVTEPQFFERGAAITEKTITAVYSGHFIIWSGMYKAAELAKKLGLDTFDDIIDHSYQYIEHPGQRVVESIRLNLKLLSDIEYSSEMRDRCLPRLNDNLSLVRDPTRLRSAVLGLNQPEFYNYVYQIR